MALRDSGTLPEECEVSMRARRRSNGLPCGVVRRLVTAAMILGIALTFQTPRTPITSAVAGGTVRSGLTAAETASRYGPSSSNGSDGGQPPGHAVTKSDSISQASGSLSYPPTGPGYCASAETGGSALGGNVDVNDVYPCGPLPINRGDSGPAIPMFWPVSGMDGGFQCTEFAQRYLYVESGHLDSFSAGGGLSGEEFAAVASSEFGYPLTSSTSGQLPQVGDIISEAYSQSDPTANSGDVAVVAAVSAPSITIIGENDTASGYNKITEKSATNWIINAGSTYQYTYFQWINPGPPSSPSIASFTADAGDLTAGGGEVQLSAAASNATSFGILLPRGMGSRYGCRY